MKNIRIANENHQNYEDLIIPRENHVNHAYHRNPNVNQENHENLIIPLENNENHENHRISIKNYKTKL